MHQQQPRHISLDSRVLLPHSARHTFKQTSHGSVVTRRTSDVPTTE
jgi:hypothetical protein